MTADPVPMEIPGADPVLAQARAAFGSDPSYLIEILIAARQRGALRVVDPPSDVRPFPGPRAGWHTDS